MKKANQNELFQQNRVSRTSFYAIIKLNFKAKQDCLKNIEKTKQKKKQINLIARTNWKCNNSLKITDRR